MINNMVCKRKELLTTNPAIWISYIPYCVMHDIISCLDVQPDDHFNFYGFSRYARELNELTPELEAVLPPTDTRYRPDQRFRIFI